MIDLFRKNRAFFLTYLVALVGVGILQLIYTKEELIRWVNSYNAPWADVFFDNATYLGDGAFSFIIIAILFIRSKWMGILASGSFAISGLLSIFLKRVVFPHNLRPLKYFEHSDWEYHVLKGLDIHSYNSFPSGHTITAFAVFSLLAMLDERKGRGWALALLAILVGYSRVYLFQHFVEDVYAGSIVGTLSTLLVFYYFNLWRERRRLKERTESMGDL
ncbi:phosphatase PAP2 family protein [Nibrella saemangeumensis]|uniref:Phosphatase PAP2 family protein n=1 Tax=Nibrella saemangeumensis TaxID=1084526 RepID=A0ABP8NE48_9BACT